jgi:hypothetical protein
MQKLRNLKLVTSAFLASLAACGGGSTSETPTASVPPTLTPSPAPPPAPIPEPPPATGSCPTSSQSDVWLERRLGCISVGQVILDLSVSPPATGPASDTAFVVALSPFDLSFNSLLGLKSRRYAYFICIKGAPSNLNAAFLAADIQRALKLSGGPLPAGISSVALSIAGGDRPGRISTTCQPTSHPLIVDYATKTITSITDVALTTMEVYDY